MPDWSLPSEFEPAAYRRLSTEFSTATDEELAAHYRDVGRAAGWPGNALQDRGAFARLVPTQAHALEIGPFASPLLAGPAVRYCDVLDTAQLRERAQGLGLDPARVPDIHHRMGPGLLDDIDATFDVVLSSHAIEHQPDLVAHLQQVERRLRPEGRYFLLVPDKRYCFDRNLAPSGIAEVLQAHEEGRTVHTLRSVVEHRALVTHSDPARHWAEDRPPEYETPAVDAAVVRAAIEEYHGADGGYIDVHAWYFTPDSFAHLVGLLRQLDLVGLELEHLYPTRRNSVEFWAVLRRTAARRLETAITGGGLPDARTGDSGMLWRMLRSVRRR